MPRRSLAPLVAGLMLAACGDTLAPELPDNGPPTTLSMNVGGWIWGSLDVTLRGDTLVVVRRPDYQPAVPPTTYRVVPTPADWGAFWRAIDAAGIRGWPARCANPNVMDGGGFELAIGYGGGARITASGTNAYPQRDGRCRDGTSPEYDAFLKAMEQLLRHPFPGP